MIVQRVCISGRKSCMTNQAFRRLVWDHYKKQGRHALPWRRTRNAYKILVSEVMLQQTQVERVIPYYKAWVKRWPTARSLASAPLSDVLKAWQGLGYNRRAKALHECAKELAKRTTFPKTKTELIKLPGIGDYTASAVLCFAYGQPELLMETNIRTAITHHFFADKKEVHDAEIREVLASLASRENSRQWNLALMDYGAHLKRTGVKLNSKAKGYRKQSKFAGSDREVRGAIVRALSIAPTSRQKLTRLLGVKRSEQVRTQLKKLEKEALVVRKGSLYSLPS